MTNYNEYYKKGRLGKLGYDLRKVQRGKSYFWQCENIVSFDIENSNGYRPPEGTVVIPYNENKARTLEWFNDEDPNVYQRAEKQTLLYHAQWAIDQGDHIEFFFQRDYRGIDEFLEFFADVLMAKSIDNSPLPDAEDELEWRFQKARKLSKQISVAIDVHNLGHEFQHLRNLYEDDFAKSTKYSSATFARSERRPFRTCIKKGKVTFFLRDTLVLTQKTLKQWGKDENLPVQKLDPDDPHFYDPIRTPITPLDELMLQYCQNDVETMIYGIRKYVNKYGSNWNIPMTQTGEVRRTCIDRICYTYAHNPLTGQMEKIMVTTEDGKTVPMPSEWAVRCTQITKHYSLQDFRNLCEEFNGGYVHANRHLAAVVLQNVHCRDVASYYPSIMTSRTFPVGEGELADPSEWATLLSQDLWDIDLKWHYEVEFTAYDIKAITQNTLTSESKVRVCERDEDMLIDNGRIDAAKKVTARMTDLMFETFCRVYGVTQENLTIHEIKKYQSGVLPAEVILTILDYYEKKTKKKGTAETSLYNESKQFINSIYGVAVTKIAADGVTLIPVYDEYGEFLGSDWHTEKMTEKEFLKKMSHTDPLKTFLTFQIGVWVTSWAQHDLWDLILGFDGNPPMDQLIAYCDTDSIKGLFSQCHPTIAAWNARVTARQAEIAARLGIDIHLFSPEDKLHNRHQIGILDIEGDCREFKTIGAKRYIADQEKDGEFHIKVTVAGLPKKAGEEMFHTCSQLRDDVVFAPWESHKLAAYYNDNQTPALWVDDFGNEYWSEDKYGVCLAPTTYSLSSAAEYIKMVESLQDAELGIEFHVGNQSIALDKIKY